VYFKLNKSCVPPRSLPKLKELSLFVDEVANLRHNSRLPWVGSAAFAHKGGTHVNAVQKLTASYEHINPELVGNTRNILVSDLAGRSNIVMKAQMLGFKVTNDTPELKAILETVKQREHDGFEFEAAEGSLCLLIRAALDHKFAPHFHVETYHVSMRRDQRESICEATVRVRVGNEIAHTVAEGEGPVNALDGALRRALVKFYPKLKSIVLTDYKVRIINGKTGTGARTRVLITSSNGRREWGTMGVSENIIEASLQALVDSMEFAFLKQKP
jgi:2-isopropylmalate synthase